MSAHSIFTLTARKKYEAVGAIELVIMFEHDGVQRKLDTQLHLVETKSMGWYIEAQRGTAYVNVLGLVKSPFDIESQPGFFPNIAAAANAAVKMINAMNKALADQGREPLTPYIQPMASKAFADLIR